MKDWGGRPTLNESNIISFGGRVQRVHIQSVVEEGVNLTCISLVIQSIDYKNSFKKDSFTFRMIAQRR